MFSWQDSWKFASTICFPGSFYPNKLNLLFQAQDISRLVTSLTSLFFIIMTSFHTSNYITFFCTRNIVRKVKEETIVKRWHSLFTNQTQTKTETQTNSCKFALLLYKYCVKL